MDKFIKHRALRPFGWLLVDVVYVVRRLVSGRADKWERT
jgi:hypothetical protein